jgi:glycosyltransferase involved in cell wall biosynthesis
MLTEPAPIATPTTLLLVAYAFPPENVSGAARPFRFYRYLPEFGVAPVVITASAQQRETPDIVFVRDVPRDFPRRGWAWHVERVVRRLLLPGELGLTWSRKAAARGCTFVPAHGRAAVFSTSPPLGAHLAALQIKRALGIPWIADFRDPFHPCAETVVPRANIHSILEPWLLREADVVIANTDDLSETWKARYPQFRDKIRVIWNGFDPAEEIAAAFLPPRGFRHLVHVGELYAGRHPGPILDSIERLLDRAALAPGSLRLSLIGPTSEDVIPNPDVLRRLVDRGVVEFVPTLVPQEKARRITREADALLLLQPQSDVQVPAKLFEYVRIGRPVLAFVRRGAPAERILAGSGIAYRAIYPDDSSAAVDAKMLEFLALPGDPAAPSAWFAERFNARRQTQTLSGIIGALDAGPRAVSATSEDPCSR